MSDRACILDQAMPDTADRAQANPDSTRLIEAAEARDDAAPSALTAGGALVLLALVGRHAGWELLGHQLWWIWVVVAFPYLLLAAVLLLGLARLVKHDHRREIVIGLLSLVWGFNVLGVGVLVASLLSQSGSQITGRQLLLSGGVVLFADAVAFGLAFWELDCGGPVARALSTAPRKPDFQSRAWRGR